MDLAGKVAIVTGNGRGLGAAIRERMLAAGAIAPKCTRRTLDVTSNDSMYNMVDFIMGSFGRIDILVNNAAILGPVDKLEDVTASAFSSTLTVNLVGPVKLMGLVAPHMIKTGGGKIINIAGGGATDPLPRRIAYAASKAALVRVTESIAAEFADAHIDVNAVLPGPLPTRMFDEIVGAGPDRLGYAEYNDHKMREFRGDEIERAADLCVYLASSESDGITGRTISARHDPWPFDTAAKAAIIENRNRYTLRRVDEVNRAISS